MNPYLPKLPSSTTESGDSMPGSDTEGMGGDSVDLEVTITASIEENIIITDSDDPDQDQDARDGNYFLNLLKTERNRLIELANESENHLNLLMSEAGTVSEDILGLLRAASGKARLLVTKKMKQFEELCYKHLEDAPGDRFITKVDDLDGYWSLIQMQLGELHKTFSEIGVIRTNGWKHPIEEKQITESIESRTFLRPKPKLKPKPTTGSPEVSIIAKKREAQRKQFLEMIRKKKRGIESDAKLAETNKNCEDKVMSDEKEH